MSGLNNFAIDHKTHVFFKNVTLNSDWLNNSSDVTAVSTHGFDRLFLIMDFPSAPAAADTEIFTWELESASSNNDTDFSAVDTANFSVAFSPGSSSATAYGVIEADIDLKSAGASRFVRPAITMAATGVTSIANVSCYAILYGGSGLQDHEMADTAGPNVNY